MMIAITRKPELSRDITPNPLWLAGSRTYETVRMNEGSLCRGKVNLAGYPAQEKQPPLDRQDLASV